MKVNSHKTALRDELLRAVNPGDASGLDRHTREVVDRLRALMAEDIDRERLQDFGVSVESLRNDDGVWHFAVLVSATLDGKRLERKIAGDCRFDEPRLRWPTVMVWLTSTTEVIKPSDDEEKPLLKAKRRVGIWLVLVGTAALASTLLLARTFWNEGADTSVALPRLLVLAALAGATGSSGAALRSFMDRTAGGVEFDHDRSGRFVRAHWPEMKKGTQRFNLNIVPGLVLRPLLGAILAPIAYATIVVGSQVVVGGGSDVEATRQVLVVLFIAGLFGMFAKSVWENLNERAKTLFQAASN